MTITIPIWIVSALCCLSIFALILLFIGMVIWCAARAITLILHAKNLRWAYRAYVTLKCENQPITSHALDDFMSTIVEDWSKGDVLRYNRIRRSLRKVEDTIPKDDLEFIEKW